MHASYLLANINEAGLPALRIVSIVAVLIFVGAGTYIFRQRHHLFDRDPDITEAEDSPAIRHVRLELVVVVWSVLLLVMLATCVEIWRA